MIEQQVVLTRREKFQIWRDGLYDWSDRTGSFLSTHSTAALLTILGAYGLLCLWHATRKPLWFDELFTMYVCRLPTLADLFRAIPTEAHPPANHLLTRLSLHLFGQTPVALRLPPLLSLLTAGACVYGFVRFRCEAVFALLAVAVLFGSGVGTYAYEGRSYGLLIAFTAFTLVCWQRAAAAREHRLLPLCGVAFGIAGAICSHHFGTLYVGAPLCAGEALRLIRNRRVDIAMIAAGVCGLSMLTITFPWMRQSRALLTYYTLHSPTFWAKPTAHSLNGLLDTFPAAMLVAFAAVLAITRWRTPLTGVGRELSRRWPSVGRALLAGVIVLIIAGFGFARPDADKLPSHPALLYIADTWSSMLIVFLVIASALVEDAVIGVAALVLVIPEYAVFGRWAFYSGISALAILGLLALVVAACRKKSGYDRMSQIPDYEVVAAVVSALLMLIIWVVTKISTHYFTSRYLVGSAVGMAIVSGFVTSMLGRRRNLFACIMLISVLAVSVVGREVVLTLLANPDHGAEIDPPMTAQTQQGPIAVADSFTYIALTWYGPPSVRNRITYLTDVQYAMYQPDVVPDTVMAASRPVIPGRVDEYSDFFSHHRRFFLYCIENPTDNWLTHHQWLKERLKLEGAKLTPVAKQGYRVLYQVTH